MKRAYIILVAALLGIFTFSACEKNNPSPPNTIPNPNITLSDLYKLYKGADVQLESQNTMEAHQIAGVVITDAASMNVRKGELVIQNTQRGEIRGITISFGEQAELSYALGDSIVVNISGGVLTRDKGTLMVKGLSPSNVAKLNEKSTVQARPVTLEELINNFVNYEGTLVTIIGANVNPPPAPNETYSGDKRLDDGSGNSIQLHTEASATFAGNKLPTNAEFTGIARYFNPSGNDTTGAIKQLWLRNLKDVGNSSGPLYPGFPEKFATDLIKNPYASADLDLSTGNWTFNGVTLVTATSARPINPDGTKATQFNQRNASPLYLQMNFDVPNGASKVTLLYGSYGTDPQCTWRLEYSTDGGSTWTQTGDDVIAANKIAQTATFLMDITGPVRFRVLKPGLGDLNNGRLNVDDFTIYQN